MRRTRSGGASPETSSGGAPATPCPGVRCEQVHDPRSRPPVDVRPATRHDLLRYWRCGSEPPAHRGGQRAYRGTSSLTACAASRCACGPSLGAGLPGGTPWRGARHRGRRWACGPTPAPTGGGQVARHEVGRRGWWKRPLYFLYSPASARPLRRARLRWRRGAGQVP